MACLRIMLPLLTVYIMVVFISSSFWKRLTHKLETETRRAGFIPTTATSSTTSSRSSPDTPASSSSPPQGRTQNATRYDQNVSLSPTVETNSPPFFDFIYQSEQICEGSNPYMLILVTSGLQNRQIRDTIRNTWGGIAKGREWPRVGHFKDIRLVFLLGEGQSASLNSEIQKEARQNNDMMIGRFSDTYRNLTNKVLMGLKWMKLFCPGAQYVMKTDDDSFLDIPKIINLVKSVHSDNTIIGSYAESHKPVRDRNDKYYVSETEYPGTVYPPHVKGCMYVIPRDLALNILNVSQRFNFLSMEDVFITGVLAEAFHVKHSGIPDELYDKNVGDDSKIDVCRFISGEKLMAHNVDLSTTLLMWNIMENPGRISTINMLKESIRKMSVTCS